MSNTIRIAPMMVLAVAFPWGVAVGAQPPVSLRMGTQAPSGGNIHRSLLQLAAKVRPAVAITFFTDGTMGGEADMVRRVRVGQLDGALLTVQGLAQIDPSVKALQQMPMMFRSLDEVDYIKQKLSPGLSRAFAERGFVVLGWGDVGWVRFFSKKPLATPQDLKNSKLFWWAGDNSGLDMARSLGLNPVPLEINDVLTGLQTGLIDTIATAPFHALAGQVYLSAPNMLELNWVPLVGAIVAGKSSWDRLPAGSQESLRVAALAAAEAIKRSSRDEMDRSVAAMRARKLVVRPLGPALEAEWRTVVEAAYPKIRGTMVPAETFDEVVRLLAEYRKSDGAGKPEVEPASLAPQPLPRKKGGGR